MARRLSLPLLIILTIVVVMSRARVAAQDTASGPTGVNRGVIPVRLAKAIDSKKAKQGEEVVCKTTAKVRIPDGTVLPTDTKIVGHITDAQAMSKGDAESTLGIAFDKIQLANGKERKISGKIQAIAPAPEVDAGGAAPGTIPVSNDAATQPPVAAQASNMNLGKNSGPMLNAQSRGVVGFRNLQMGVDSVLTSTAKEIRLNSRTQLMLNVEFQ